MLKNKFKNSLIALAAVGVLTLSTVQPVHAAASLQGGDFFQAFNNTTQEGTWRDPVTGKSGELIEFRVTAKNNGDEVAHNVQVWGSTNGQVPQSPSNTLTFSAKIANADFGGQELTDSVTVNVTGQPEGMRYAVGHARLNGVTNLHNCPQTCNIGDNVLGGIEVGDIQPGDFVEVTFKAYLTNTPGSTPTPTPTPSATPTPTPTPGGGITINNNNNNTNNNSQTQTQNVTVNTPAVAAPQVVTQVQSQAKALPKTGLPLAAVGMSALLPIGLKLRKRFIGSDTDSANFIWEERLFKKD